MQYPEKLKEEFEDSKGVIRIVNRKKLPTQWQKEKGQKDKQRYTKHTYKTKDPVTQTPLKTVLFNTYISFVLIRTFRVSWISTDGSRDYHCINICISFLFLSYVVMLCRAH